jgi:predicted lipoprotein with Yx(FWY)xxD motif
VWPAFTTSGAAQASSGATASLLGTSTSSGGQALVTYNGHPLYYYVGDNKPGDTNGQNLDQFGGSWYVLSASGTQVGQ